jgi:hypothetical protein
MKILIPMVCRTNFCGRMNNLYLRGLVIPMACASCCKSAGKLKTELLLTNRIIHHPYIITLFGWLVKNGIFHDLWDDRTTAGMLASINRPWYPCHPMSIDLVWFGCPSLVTIGGKGWGCLMGRVRGPELYGLHFIGKFKKKVCESIATSLSEGR